MKFIIPKEIELMWETIKIITDPNLIQNWDSLWEARYRTSEIIIQPNVTWVNRTEDSLNETYFHELIHFIFKKLWEDKLRNDEKIISQIASLLWQSIKTSKY